MKMRYILVALGSALAMFALFALRDNRHERKTEGKTTVFKLVDLPERTTDPAQWGKNFPRQYDSYKRTVDMDRTRYGGSEPDPTAAGADDVHQTLRTTEHDSRPASYSRPEASPKAPPIHR